MESFLLNWVELSRLGTFVRESPSIFGYPTFLFFHTAGLSILVGCSSVVGLRVLGLAPNIPLKPLARLFPLMWIAFWVNLVSGSGLWAADAVNKTIPGGFRTQAPVFIVKMLLVVLAVVCMQKLRKRLFADASIGERATIPQDSKVLAGTMLGLWLLAMIAGRMIAYSSLIIPV